METKRKIYIGGCLMKKYVVICAPVTSRSGYGDHARDLVRAFIKLEKLISSKSLILVYTLLLS